jgi:hypothetical protein
MGLRISKRLGLGKLARLNISKSGISIGLGPSGLNVNVKPGQTRTTVGVPGSGIFWYKQQSHPTTRAGYVGFWIVVLGLLLAWFFLR